jgi:flagellin
VGAGTSYANTAQGLISAINGSGLGLTASFGTAAQAGTAAVAAANASTDDTTATSASTNTGIIISGAGIGSGSAATGADGAGEVGTVTLTAATSGAADAATLSGTLSIVGSDGKTHNITLGTANSTDTLSNLASTINAAGYGVTATYNAAATATSANIVFTSANSGVTVSQTSLASTATTTALAGTPTASGTSQTTTLGTISGGATATGSLTFGTSTVSWTGAQTLTQLAGIINAGNYGVSASLNNTGTLMTITSANSALPALTAGTANGLTSVAGGTTSEQYYDIGITGTVADSSTSAGTATVGITADNNGTGGVATISYSDAAGQSLSNTDLSNQTNAQAALTALNTAISDVAAQDGYIGAQINTLNAVSSVLSTQSENVTSAQNAVQATDYASATSNMSKYEILSQTGIAALAQANSIQQEVTKLLQ